HTRHVSLLRTALTDRSDLPAAFSSSSFNDPATTEIYTLSLHDALPIFEQLFSPTVDAVIPGNPERARLDADIDLVPGLKAVKVVCIDGEALVFLPFAPGVHD